MRGGFRTCNYATYNGHPAPCQPLDRPNVLFLLAVSLCQEHGADISSARECRAGIGARHPAGAGQLSSAGVSSLVVHQPKMPASESSSSTASGSGTLPTPSHPFANAKGLLVVIPQDRVDIAEESALYDEFEDQSFGVCVASIWQ